jgi:hypothetical protein
MSVNINADTTNGLVLTSDTSGEIKLQSAGADIATVDSSGITMAAGKTLPASALTGSLPAGMGGKILQVLQATKTDAFSTTSTSYVDLTGLSISITPSSTSSKILVFYNIDAGTAGDVAHGYLTLIRGSTEIFKADTAGNRRSATSVINTGTQTSQMHSASYLDSPSTTGATTYKVQILSSNGSTIYVNRSGRDLNSLTNDGRSVSSITVMEVGA